MSWDWGERDLAALAAFLGEGPLRAQRIGDGHSALSFRITGGARDLVVRRGPPPPSPPGAYDMLREARLIGALAGTAVPVPEIVAVAEAGAVLDVPFYVMSHVDGEVITDRTPPALATPAERRRIAEAMVDTLAALHALDPGERGVLDLGRPEGFNARHLRRMNRLAEVDGELPRAFADVHAWLADHAPRESGVAIVHSDFRLGNLMFARSAPARLVAVLDWELATIGDPLLDVGYVASAYARPGTTVTPAAELNRATLEDGYPARDELLARYAATTGRDLGALPWYTAMALYKLAALYEQARRRALDPYYADPALVERFLDAARAEAGLPAGASAAR